MAIIEEMTGKGAPAWPYPVNYGKENELSADVLVVGGGIAGCHAAINAAKQTHLLIPHCHQIPLDSVSVQFKVNEGYIEANCTVRAQARTGVEMEAVIGVSMALNTLWDMVKYIEKDSQGQYPHTSITDIRVLTKKKGE